MTGAPGFQWSLGCVGPVGWGGLSLEPLSDGGSALFVNVDVGALDLGGDDLMVIGGGDMALARHDAEGSAVWSDVWGNDGAQWAFGGDGLPGGGLVIGLYSEDGPIEVGGAPIELDPSLGSAVVVALDGGGAARWSHVASTMVPDSVIGVAVVAAEDGSVLASFSAPEPGPIFLDGVGPHDVGEGRLAARFSADGSLQRTGVLEEGVPVALFEDESLVLAVDGGIARTDSTWAIVWQHRWGSWGISALAVAPDGGVVVAGSFGDHVDLGGGSIESDEVFDADLGNTKAFLGRYAADGSHLWSAGRLDARGVLDVGFDLDDTMLAILYDDEGKVRIERLDGSGGSIGAAETPVIWPEGGRVTRDGAALLYGSAMSAIDLGGGPMSLHADGQVWIARYVP